MVHEFSNIKSLNPQFTEQEVSASKSVNVDVKEKVKIWVGLLPKLDSEG